MKQQSCNIIQVKKISCWHLLTLIIILFCALPCTEIFAQDKPLVPTPRDAEGPFYPVIRQADEDNNLLQIASQNKAAAGDILYLSGRVIDVQGKPYSNATVEIWQTDMNGLYKDQRDRSVGTRDPYFQYWGKAKCDEDGSYLFTTIVPGEYHPRPAHIHFKVWINDSVRLTSQMYFNQQVRHGNTKTTKYVTPELQTVELQKIGDGRYKGWFQIVL